MPHQNNCADPTQRQKIISAIFDEGMTKAETAKRFGFPYSTVSSIVNAFEEDGRMENKPRGGNRRRVVEEVHLEWLMEKLRAHPDTTIANLHRQLNEHFNLQPPFSFSAVEKAV